MIKRSGVIFHRAYRNFASQMRMRAFALTLLLLLTSWGHAQKPHRETGGQRAITDSVQSLEFGANLRALLSGGEVHSYSINAPANSYLRILVEQQGVDIEVTLVSSSGKTLISVDNANGTRGTEFVSFLTATSESFRVRVKTKEPKPSPAYYSIRIAEQRLATEDDAKRVDAERALAAGETLRATGTLSSYNEALVKYEEAFRLWEGVDATAAATALLDEGKAYFYLLNMEEAIRKYQQALAVFKENGLHLDEGVAQLYIGMAKLALGENSDALGFYERGLALFTEENDERYLSFALNEIGRAYYLRGDANKAIEYYRQALQIRHTINDRKGESFTLVSMGRAYSNGFGDDGQALDLYKKALDLQRAINNGRLIAQTLGDIGRIYYKAGNLQTALSYYVDALHAAENGDQSVKAELLMYIGQVYLAWGRHREALEQYFNEALRLQEGRDPVGRARTLQYMGRAYAALGDDTNALRHFNDALEVWQRVQHRTAEAETRYNIALIESRRGHYAEACQQIKAALPVVETLRTGIANLALRTNYFASVQNYYELYINALMRLSEQTNDKGLEALALSISESKRARALLDVLIDSKTDVRPTVADPELLNREAAIQKELSAQSLRQITGEHLTAEQVRRLDSLVAEFYEVEAQIRKKAPRYAALTRPVPPSLRQIQNELLANDQMLLEYSLGDERSYLWAVTKTAVKSYVLPKRSDIEVVVLRFVKLLTARNNFPAGEAEAARKLRLRSADAEYEVVSATLATMLGLDRAPSAAASRLLIVGDAEMQYVPFAALLVPSKAEPKQTPTNSSLVPLIVDHEIEQPPSMSLVAELKRERRETREGMPEKTIAVIADPVFSRGDERCCKPLRGDMPGTTNRLRTTKSKQTGTESHFASENLMLARKAGMTDRRGHLIRLRLTEVEAEEILEDVPPSEQLKAVGFDAKLTLLTDESTLSAYRILHFATHGFLNPDHPELSGILLSLVNEQGKAQNGFLQMQQIFTLHLPAELVVLSACETGISKNIRGEGLNGISRGFMYAGAKRVVASLWEVNDGSTTKLMKYFYENLRVNENRDLSRGRPASALRAAQLQMMRQPIWRHPYFWAAFVVQGETG